VPALVAVLGMLAACSSRPPPAPVAQEHPDFSGWWSWEVAVGRFPSPFLGAPFTPQLAPAVAQMAAAYDSADLPDPVALGAKPGYCLLPSFGGFNGGFENSIEFLMTPGRVTITNEGGMLRRVFLDAPPPPADVDATRHGMSTGHWEGSTLVIETTGLSPDNPLYLSPFQIGPDVHVVERIWLEGPDTLAIALKMTAPAVFTQPYETKLVYKRDRDYTFHEYSVCEQYDRSLDPRSSRQRFDLTPPGDLPPPPPG
jgi:hypothetical protein